MKMLLVSLITTTFAHDQLTFRQNTGSVIFIYRHPEVCDMKCGVAPTTLLYNIPNYRWYKCVPKSAYLRLYETQPMSTDI